MQQNTEAFEKLGAKVVAVAAGQQLRELEDYAEEVGLSFPLAADDDRKVIKSYGVHHWRGVLYHNISRKLVFPGLYLFDKLGFPLVGEETRKAIRSRGIFHWFGLAGHDVTKSIARPGTFIIDKNGVIRHAYVGSSQFDMIDQSKTVAQLESLNR